MVWAVIFVGGAAVSAVVLWKLRRRKYRIAVLGAQYSGKTTLINSWRGQWVADEADTGRTQAPHVYSKTKLTTEGLKLTFTNLTDLSGSKLAWPVWEDRAKESRYVLYLVDARALAGYLEHLKNRNWQRLEDDAGQLGRWIEEGHAELCILVVTHTDQDARLEKLGEEEYRESVATQLDPLILKLGGPRIVRVVVGSLKTLPAAETVTSLMMDEIISWEKSK
jgi:GTPase SAR1 family protein